MLTLNWVSKYILFMTKLKGVGRPTLETESIDLSSELSPKYGGDVKQSVYYP